MISPDLTCEDCGKTGPTVAQTFCPYCQEIDGEDVPVTLCPDCIELRSDEI